MTNLDKHKKGPGRPRAIPEHFIPEILYLYRSGLGYRSIARELEQQGLVVTWSTVRRLIKTQLEQAEP